MKYIDNESSICLSWKEDFLNQIQKFKTEYAKHKLLSHPITNREPRKIIGPEYVQLKDPKFSWTMIQQRPNVTWEYFYISQNPNISWNIVLNNPDKPWNYTGLSKNPNITWSIIQANLHKPWDWNLLSLHPNITIHTILTHPRNNIYKWDYMCVSCNPSITIEIVKNNVDIPWCWYWLSIHENITFENITENMHLPWDWKYISYNPNITMSIIENNRNLPWDWDSLGHNPNITTDFILKNINMPWNDSCIMKHSFTNQQIHFLNVQEEEFFKRRKQSLWKEELMKERFHPSHIDKFQEWGFIEID